MAKKIDFGFLEGNTSGPVAPPGSATGTYMYMHVLEEICTIVI